MRKAALDKRRFIENKDEKSKIIAAKIIELAKEYSKIGLYLHREDEVNVDKAIEELVNLGKRVYVPTSYENYLEFHEFEGWEQLKEGRYHILESDGSIGTDLDVVFVPLVAFDENKYRLGMGKGYYDRYLDSFEGFSIGVAFEEQKVDSVIREEHDVALDMIISEMKNYK